MDWRAEGGRLSKGGRASHHDIIANFIAFGISIVGIICNMIMYASHDSEKGTMHGGHTTFWAVRVFSTK